MKTLTMLLEMRCNNFCIFCGQRAIDAPMIEKRNELGLSIPTDVPQPGAEASLEEKRYTLESAVAKLEEAAADGVTALSLQGGEPSLWPWVVELCQTAHDLGFEEIQMVTNGQRFATRKFCRRILEARLSAVVFSLLGADAETHDGQTLVPGSFDKIVDGVGNCLEIADELGSDVRVTAAVVVSRRNYEQLPEIVDLMVDLGLRGGHFTLVRFEHFGDDPQVREWLRFHVEDAVPYVVEARRRAEIAGFTLEVDGFPSCLLPSMRAVEFKKWQRRRQLETHDVTAPAFDVADRDRKAADLDNLSRGDRENQAPVPRGGIRGLAARMVSVIGASVARKDSPDRADPPVVPELYRVAFRRCGDCLLEQGCEKPPIDHIDPERSNCFEPVTIDTFRAQVRSLGRVSERIEWRFFDWRGTLGALIRSKLISPTDVASLESEYLEACLEALAARSADETELRRRLFARTLGLQLPRSLQPADLGDWGRGWRSWSRAGASSGPAAAERATHLIDAQFAHGFSVRLVTAQREDDTHIVIDVTADTPSEVPPAMGVDAQAMFFGDLVRPFANGARVRVEGASVRAMGSGGRWHPVILPATPETGLVSVTTSEIADG